MRTIARPRWAILAAAVLVAEAVGCAAWWASLALRPDWRPAFRVEAAADATLLQFLVPDLLLYIALPLLAAAGLIGGARWAWGALVAHAGAASYAALACWGLVIFSGGEGWLGALLMTPPLLALPVFVVALRPVAWSDADPTASPLEPPCMPRLSAPAPAWWNCAKMLAQTTAMWTVFLVLLPWLVHAVEASTGLAEHRFESGVARVAVVALFTLAGSVAIFGGLWLSVRGDGTPLPADTARLLVTDGPYAFVRNPPCADGNPARIRGRALPRLTARRRICASRRTRVAHPRAPMGGGRPRAPLRRRLRALPRGGAAVDSAVPRMAQRARRLTPSAAKDLPELWVWRSDPRQLRDAFSYRSGKGLAGAVGAAFRSSSTS